jgi:hypothetical protein
MEMWWKKFSIFFGNLAKIPPPKKNSMIEYSLLNTKSKG